MCGQKKLHKEIKDAGGTTHGLNQYIKKSRETWHNRKMNVAVTGNSGAGKSSLINALRNMKPSDEGAAEVGVVETTTMCREYTYPNNEFVALWDLPGIGSQTLPRDQYLKAVTISLFNVVIIVTSSRFVENDMWLAEQICALGNHVLFVRTKIDTDMTNTERDYPDDFEEEKYISKIRADMTKNVRQGGLSQTKIEIYLVSSVKRNSYDFNILTEKLKELLNSRNKAIPAILKGYVKEAIEEKQESVKNEFTINKCVSVIYGFLPLPFLETSLGNLNVDHIRECCLKTFCLDGTSLDTISKELDEPKASLMNHLKSYKILEGPTGKTLLEATEEKEYPATVGKYSKYILPIIGSFYSAHKNVYTLEKCLDKICVVAAEDELGLVTKILNKLDSDLRFDI